MNPPPLISVEAAVKSNRSDFSSVFEVDDGNAQHSLKDFFADPVLMKQCVAKLKKDGFKVNQLGKVSLSVQGPTALFESCFNVKIIQTKDGITCEGVERFGYIDVENSDYSGLLAGIAFSPEATFQGADFDENLLKKGQISISDIVWNLEPKWGKKDLLGSELNTRINVAIIDSGFYFHPYILKYSSNDLENITVESVWDQTYIDRLDRDLRELFDFQRSAVSLYNRVDSLAGYSVLTDVDDLPDIIKAQFNNLSLMVFDVLPDLFGIELKRVSTISELVKLLDKVINRWGNTITEMVKIRDEADPENHGTKVGATLLEFVRDTNTQIRVMKTAISDPLKNFQAAFKQLETPGRKEAKPDIVNCSFGTYISKAATQEPQSKLPPKPDTPTISPLYYLYKLTVESMVARGITVVFGAGNFSSKSPNTYRLEPQWPFVISVGGAYKPPTAPAFIYSDDSHGYVSKIFPNRVVPDICGINGPKGLNMTWFPKVPDDKVPYDWEPRNGTSFAAPQVTGICVFIKKVFPSATPAQIKEILIRTAQPIGSGESSQDIEMNTLRHQLPNGDEIAPGVLNMDLSVVTAKVAHILTIKGRTPVDMSYAVRRAKEWLASLEAGN